MLSIIRDIYVNINNYKANRSAPVPLGELPVFSHPETRRNIVLDTLKMYNMTSKYLIDV